jgi:hypothetical protein
MSKIAFGFMAAILSRDLFTRKIGHASGPS